MATKLWDDFEFSNESKASDFDSKKTVKQKKRKWREIENKKEQYRLQKELLAFDEYHL